MTVHREKKCRSVEEKKSSQVDLLGTYEDAGHMSITNFPMT
jgi:hypothetical protein